MEDYKTGKIQRLICNKPIQSARGRTNMSTIEQIETAILTLPLNDFEKLRQWFFDLDYQRWDEQLEKDIVDGKLEIFAQEAIAEFNAGNCREI